MRARKLVVSLSLTAVIVAGLAGPATAHGGHGSCADFGAEIKAEAQENGGLGGIVAPLATSGPGSAAGIVAAEQDAFCE